MTSKSEWFEVLGKDAAKLRGFLRGAVPVGCRNSTERIRAGFAGFRTGSDAAISR